ncbi:MAG: uncharacterized protein KVP18_003042 [Porospora cf. gigantea A]|uniref:uncharacterized protein n=1 Tax=Porospora cf. gigantea A TaxID=2853593 RepID=UPI00355A8E8C|nr:MAG: hypothetical protein KVP18_003042 [Porospora cf. gigantea A]
METWESISAVYLKQSGLPPSTFDVTKRSNIPYRNMGPFDLARRGCRRLVVHENPLLFTRTALVSRNPFHYWNAAGRYYHQQSRDINEFIGTLNHRRQPPNPRTSEATHDADGNLYMGPLTSMCLATVERQEEQQALPPECVTRDVQLELERQWVEGRIEAFVDGDVNVVDLDPSAIQRAQRTWDNQQSQDEELAFIEGLGVEDLGV